MRVCLVLISDGWGGAENVVYNLARKLSEKEDVILLLNHEIVKYFLDIRKARIFETSSLYNLKSLIKSIIHKKDIENKEFNSLSFGFFYFLNELLRFLYYKRIQGDLLKMLNQEEVGIIHLHLENSLKLFYPLLRKLDVPVIFTVHGFRSDLAAGKAKFIGRAIVRKGMTIVDKVTCVSRYLLRKLVDSGITFARRPTVIYNGVDIKGIRKAGQSKIALRGDFRLLFPGGKKFSKGGDLVIRALPTVKRVVPNVHLYFAGIVPEDHMLRILVQEKGLVHDVSFLGLLAYPKYCQVLSSVDILVFPAKDEAFGIVLLEAMALGKPIVATRIGGIPEVVEDMRNGVLVERDPSDIAEAVIHLYKNRDVFEIISRNNFERVESFDWDNIINDYILLYATLLDEKLELSHCSQIASAFDKS